MVIVQCAARLIAYRAHGRGTQELMMTTRQFSTWLCAAALALVSVAGCKDANHARKANPTTSQATPGNTTGSGAGSGTTGSTALTDTEGSQATGQNASSVKAPAPGAAGRNGNDPVDSSKSY
jgi:hypothetical protein